MFIIGRMDKIMIKTVQTLGLRDFMIRIMHFPARMHPASALDLYASLCADIPVYDISLLPVTSTQLECAEGKSATYVVTEVINCFQAPSPVCTLCISKSLNRIGTLGEMRG